MRKTALVALALAAGAATAQDARRPDPRDPSVTVPPAAYRSAFEGYRPFTDAEARDWRKANEQTGALGGHKGHVAPPAPARQEESQGAPKRGHEGHHK